MGKTFKIAAIAGDGIDQEVMPEGVRVVEAAAVKFGLKLEISHFDRASCDYFLQHGKMMPDDRFATLEGFDAIYFGAVGWPDKVPDHISLWGSLLKFRREFDQYVNLRPVRLLPGVPCPLANRKPGDIDFLARRDHAGHREGAGGRPAHARHGRHGEHHGDRQGSRRRALSAKAWDGHPGTAHELSAARPPLPRFLPRPAVQPRRRLPPYRLAARRGTVP